RATRNKPTPETKSPAIRGRSRRPNGQNALAARRTVAVTPTIDHRLIRDARVIAAVGHALDRLTAAEEELGRARIADRPTALVVVELKQRATLPDRNDVLDELGLGLDLELVRIGERGVAAHLRAHAQHVRVRAWLARTRRRRRRRLGAG